MILNHEDQLNITYENSATIKISPSEDRRPAEEKIEGETAINSLSLQIWSGLTSPQLMIFFQSSLSKEVEMTDLFYVREEYDFELTGCVTSMKVDRKVTLWRYAGAVPLIIGILTSERGDYNNLLIGAGAQLFLISLDFQP